MDQTTNLKLPYILAAQSQKHVTHNEALRALDAVVQLAVADKDLATPPGAPAAGSRYIVAASPTGAWAGHAGHVAAFQDGAWAFYVPAEGWLAWVADEDALYVFNGTSWIPNPAGGGGGVNPVSLVGINATADAGNRLAVSSPASLFSHEGAGHQLKINKASAGQTGSVLFQTGFSGRAEFGLTGDDDFHVKVSANGSAWNEALIINRSSGAVGGPGFVAGVRANILGTVSQSGGTPTGAIVERGSNANGEYVRFADGTQMCWGNTSITPSPNTWTTVTVTYPAAFAASPFFVPGASSTVWGTTLLYVQTETRNASQAVIGVIRTNATAFNPYWFAFGRWF